MIHVFLNIYVDPDHVRDTELRDIEKLWSAASGIKLHRLYGYPTFAEYIAAANEVVGDDDVALVVNSDCYLVETHLLAEVGKNEAWCISGSDLIYEFSQNAWAWRGKLQVDGGNFTLGKERCDNVIANILRKARGAVRNPSLSLTLLHHHNSNLRRWKTLPRVDGQGLFVAPERMCFNPCDLPFDWAAPENPQEEAASLFPSGIYSGDHWRRGDTFVVSPGKIERRPSPLSGTWEISQNRLTITWEDGQTHSCDHMQGMWREGKTGFYLIQTTIPRHFHQIWIGPYRIPSRESGFVALMKEKHPDFNHTLWTNDNLPPMPGKIGEVYRKFGESKDYAFQADILRVLVIHLFGGVYADVDYEPGKGINRRLLNCRAFFQGRWGDDFSLSNGLFGAAAGCPFLSYMLGMVSPERTWYGPRWLGESLRSFYNKPHNFPHNDLARLCASDGIIYAHENHAEGEYLRHRFLYSWSKENREKFAKGDYT